MMAIRSRLVNDKQWGSGKGAVVDDDHHRALARAASYRLREDATVAAAVPCLFSPQMSCSTKSTSVWHCAFWKYQTGNPENTTGPLSNPW